MKKLFVLAYALFVLGGTAYAETCYTNCYWVGDTQYCTTTCNPY